MKIYTNRIRFILKFIVLLCISIVIVIYMKHENNNDYKEYLFFGENEFMELKNGYINHSSDIDIINSGKIIYKETIKNIKSYTLAIYIDHNNRKKFLLIKSKIIKSEKISLCESSDFLGERRQIGLFDNDDIIYVI